MLRRIIYLTLIIACFCGVATGCHTIERADYGLKDSDIHLFERTEVIEGPIIYPPPKTYDQEEISNIYLLYAIASLNAYGYKHTDGAIYERDGELSGFVVESYSEDWIRAKRKKYQSGLSLDYYFNDKDKEVFRILIAFRGTEFNSLNDWWSNFSWLTQLLPFKNQYDEARSAVMDIIEEARNIAGNRKISIITTGHSLGGGLSEHITYAFPKVSAVVFDSSFVVNKYRLSQPFEGNQVVHVFEKNDELTLARRLFLSDEETPTYKRYGLNPIQEGQLQHKSEPLAVGMARMVAMCQADSSRPNAPGCPKNDRRAKILYCNSRYAAKEHNEPQCK